MKKFLIIIIVLISSCSTTSIKGKEKDNFGSIAKAEFVKNYDGDTITVNIKGVHPLIGNNISVRIYGIDTPEIRSKESCEKEKALKAKNLVYKILSKAKVVSLKEVKRDKYFRILAKVYADGVNLSKILIDKNLAYPYFGKTKRTVNWCSVL
jgi:micrococcal nuclease